MEYHTRAGAAVDAGEMEYARKIYPALRNRMPEKYLAELNRSNRTNPGDTLHSFFKTIHSKREDLWVSTFRDVTKYMQERMNGEVETALENDRIRVDLTHQTEPGDHLP